MDPLFVLVGWLLFDDIPQMKQENNFPRNVQDFVEAYLEPGQRNRLENTFPDTLRFSVSFLIRGTYRHMSSYLCKEPPFHWILFSHFFMLTKFLCRRHNLFLYNEEDISTTESNLIGHGV